MSDLRKPIPLSNPHGQCGGRAYTSTHLQHQPTGWQISQGPAGVKCNTYELNAVHVSIPLNKLIDIPIFHPCGNHRKPLLTDRHSNER